LAVLQEKQIPAMENISTVVAAGHTVCRKLIPAMENISTVVAAGHTVCRKLDDGIPARTVLDGLDNDAFGMNPALREQSDRLAATMSRFIAAAVEVYCPGDQGKIASLAGARKSTAPAGRFVAAHHRLRTGTGGAVLGSPVDTIATGDASQPKPPKRLMVAASRSDCSRNAGFAAMNRLMVAASRSDCSRNAGFIPKASLSNPSRTVRAGIPSSSLRHTVWP
ncbi:DUF732 domain-containing protein, partial [Mycobacterium sp. P7213]|uniref:DUF732 domain-containing protein n=1 Tax=Mycobacterium sp. P7213 TaxID=2478465 RepID=UPI0013DDE218